MTTKKKTVTLTEDEIRFLIGNARLISFNENFAFTEDELINKIFNK
jgi:hypothetical protein